MLIAKFNEKIAKYRENREHWAIIRKQEQAELCSIERMRDTQELRKCAACNIIRSPYEASIGTCDNCGSSKKENKTLEII